MSCGASTRSSKESNQPLVRRRRRPQPSTRMVHTESSQSSPRVRCRENAICRPSGDQTASLKGLPSAVRMSRTLLRFHSGDFAASVSARAGPCRRRVRRRPESHEHRLRASAFITTRTADRDCCNARQPVAGQRGAAALQSLETVAGGTPMRRVRHLVVRRRYARRVWTMMRLIASPTHGPVPADSDLRLRRAVPLPWGWRCR